MRWKRILVLLILAALLGGGAWFVVVRMEREAPVINFSEELNYIGKETGWSFTVEDGKSGLSQVKVWVQQGSPPDVEAYVKDFPAVDWRARGGTGRHKVTLALDPAGLKLTDGGATVIIAAQDNSLWRLKGNMTFLKIPVVVDTKPPRIDLVSTVHNVRPGGTGLVSFRLSEVPERVGVEVGETFFPAYPESGGDGAYLGFFALSHDAPKSLRLAIVAGDEAGNETRRIFPSRIHDKNFPRDTIRISDGFLERKVPEFQSEDPTLSGNLLEAYLTVNREWRSKNHDRIREICSESTPERLWSGAFLQMPNTKNMSAYAVKRSYVYKGKIVDTQFHLGIDLASTAGASVPAANSGIVVMAEGLGIYGQTVILDHGQGLFSLYSHLSSIAVATGDRVGRGVAIGSSGQTGMAGGDHLHFSVLVSGEFVSPVEWLDGHWIADNIENKLGLFVPPAAD